MITSATYRSSVQVTGTTYDVVVRLVTDDGRGTFDQTFRVAGTTVPELRDAVSKEIARLNSELGVKNVLAGIAQGTAIPVTYTPPAAPAATAFQVWREKAARLARLKALGLTNQAAVDDIAALEADVNTTYQAGYAAQF